MSRQTTNKQTITNPENKANPGIRMHSFKIFIKRLPGEREEFLKVWPLIGCPSASGWPHRDEIMDITNWTLWVKKRKT